MGEQLLLILTGGFIGIVGSILKDYFLEKTKKKYKEIEFKRNKLEELYIEIDNWFNYNSVNNAIFLLSLDDKSINHLEEKNKFFKYDLIKIEMMISIYLEKLTDDYNKIISKWNELKKLKSNLLKKEVSIEEKDKYKDLHNDFTNQVKNFKTDIVKEIRNF